jgi:hypothetical protein
MVEPPMSWKIIAVKVNSSNSGLTGKFFLAISKTLWVWAIPKSFFSRYGFANSKSFPVSILFPYRNLSFLLAGYLAVCSSWTPFNLVRTCPKKNRYSEKKFEDVIDVRFFDIDIFKAHPIWLAD